MQAKKGMNKLAKALIYKGVEVNKKDIEGNVPLIYAYREGNTEMSKILIHAGADINIVDEYGTMALIYAYANDNEEIVKILKGKMPEDEYQKNDQNVIETELVEQVFNIKMENNDNSILLKACREGKVEVAKELIEKGANCKILSKLSDIQIGEIYNEVIRKYLNESVSKLDGLINRLYRISKNKDKEISKVSSELDKVKKVLTDLKEVNKVHKYNGYENELAQQKINLLEVRMHNKERYKDKENQSRFFLNLD